MRAAVFVVAAAFALIARAEAAYLPGYGYRGDVLVVSLFAPEPEEVTFTFQAVHSDGRPEAATARKTVQLVKGQNLVELEVGRASGHRVRFKRNGHEITLWANRGAWAAGPEGIEIERNRGGIRTPFELVCSGDVVLTHGFAAAVLANPDRKRLTVERTLGYSESDGIRPQGHSALVLIAKGSVGPVRVTVATRVKDQLQYRDYELVLDPDFRRFEIPLAAFRPRQGGRSAPPSMHSIAISTALTPTDTSSITVGFLGLGDVGPHIQRIDATPHGARVLLAGPPRSDRQLFFATDAAVATIDVKKNPVEIGDPITQKVWLCHRHEQATVCDPPDAPHTYYLRPPRAGESLLIDDFESSANVTAQRELVKPFASSEEIDRRMTFEQREGALRLGVPAAARTEYAGVDVHLATPLPRDLPTLELRLRGDASTGAVTISTTDQKGAAARLELRAYAPQLGDEWRTVSIPMSAFQAAPPEKLTLTLFGRETPATLELDYIRFAADQAPVALAGFDLSRDDLTDVAGAIGYESSQGQIEGALAPGGHTGRGLRIHVHDLSPDGYALTSLGLGRLDARGHRAIQLSARREGEAGRISLVVGDGVKKARFDDMMVGTDWTTIELPLEAATKQGVRIDRLSQLLLVWEGRAASDETVIIDDVRLE